jgi:hypothetical protein
MSQKIPLFNGVIASAPVAAAPGIVTPIFTPPDSNSDAPNIYEVHLWVSPRLSNLDPVTAQVQARERSGTPVPVWQGVANAGVTGYPIVKALDGYPVRGDVTLEMLSSAPVGGDPIFMWGYYRRVGEGPQLQPERRPIGQALTPFNAGVPFAIAPGASQIIHVFEPNRIDEISLAAFIGGLTLMLTFEDINNGVLATPFLFIPVGANTYQPVAGDFVGPQGSLFPPSPYFIHQCPFGGGYLPTLHHIRAWNLAAEGNPDAIFHGYFTRR